MSKKSLTPFYEQIVKCKLLSGSLSGPKDKLAPILKVSIRPLFLKQEKVYQLSFHYKTKVIHQNKSPQESADLIINLLKNEYKQGIFTTQDQEYHILSNKHQELTIISKPSKAVATLSMHNRKKNYVLEEGVPVPFLVDLGIMTAEGKVIAKKFDKFKQINRFLEMVRDVVDHLPKDRSVQIIDFGCGKAYLTFAMYHYLHVIEGLSVSILGLDLKRDVIEHCDALAKRLDYSGLHFAVGDINQHVAEGKVDLVITLHACDTATDAALEKAVSWGAEVILCVPCCQHELFSQIKNEGLTTLLQHGLLKERFSALVTDAARAEILTMLGYEVQVLEFIDMEHTPKNVLIRAVKGKEGKGYESRVKNAGERFRRISEMLNINLSVWKGLD